MDFTHGPYNNRFYSERFAQLHQCWTAHPGMRAARIDLQAEGVPAFMQDYAYPVAAWPVIISQARVTGFQHFIDALPGIYLRAIGTMFGSDSAAFSRYMEVPELLHQVLLNYEIDPCQLLQRYDLLFSNGDLKLIEANSGSTIGGWQPGLLETQFRDVFGQFQQTAGWELHHRNALRALLAAVCRAIRRKKPKGGGGHVLVYGVSGSPLGARMREEYAAAFQGVPDGEIHFLTDWSEMEFLHDGAVAVRGVRMDAVLMTVPEERQDMLPKEILMPLMAAELAGHIVFPDSAQYLLFGNKMLMALVHEAKVQAAMTEQERALVARHIPLTVPMTASELRWGGRSMGLREALLAHREDYVVKKSQSLQGRDVFIGKQTDPARWAALVDDHLGRPGWLAQAYCRSDVSVATDANGKLTDYTFIWGIFDAGGSYGGAFVRGMPVAAGQGVINSATGATEFAVFEEVVKRNKITI